MDAIRSFWETWGMWISLALIPTLITGLSLSPKTKQYATWLGKLWDGIKPYLARFSVATFKDQPGTFKAPLTSGVKEDKPLPPAAGPGCAAALFCVLSSAIPVSSCAWLSSTGSKVEEVVIDCAIQSVKDVAIQILPVVVAILTGNSPDWRKMLEGLAKEMGRDVVACALNEAAIELQAKIPATGPDGTSVTAEAMQGTQKARTYLGEKKWQFKENQ